MILKTIKINENNIVHSKGIANSYKNKYIDHALFKKNIN